MGYIIKESVEEMISSDESIEKNKKQKEYLDYINKHILNVQRIYVKFFLPLLEKDNLSTFLSDQEIKEAINRASVSVADHDLSKYGDEEFDGYREKYYPTATERADPDYEQKSKERFQKAWDHHSKTNWHHQNYWIDDTTGTIKDMNLEAIIEMLCDWMSFDFDVDKTIEWYNTKAYMEKKMMSENTKRIVEEFLFHILKS